MRRAAQERAGRPVDAGPGAGDDTLFARYRRAIAAYDPAPYPGRLAVLRSETMKDLRPSLGWSAIGKDVELCTRFPATTSRRSRSNIATTAARLRACLDAALHVSLERRGRDSHAGLG